MTRTLTIVTLFISFTALLAFAADSGKRITITGRAVGTPPAAAEEAKLDALREAVRRVDVSADVGNRKASNPQDQARRHRRRVAKPITQPHREPEFYWPPSRTGKI